MAYLLLNVFTYLSLYVTVLHVPAIGVWFFHKHFYRELWKNDSWVHNESMVFIRTLVNLLQFAPYIYFRGQIKLSSYELGYSFEFIFGYEAPQNSLKS